MHFLSCAGELNHHGRFMCDSLYNLLGDDFQRITTQQVNAERLNLGYNQNAIAPYNKQLIGIDKKTICEVIQWSDVVDYGAAPEIYLREAVKKNKIVFIRIERLFKEGFWKIFVPQVFIRYYRKYIKYRNNPNVFYLCVSGYAARDLARIGVKNERVLQWAYCPEFIELNETDFNQKSDKLQLLWCGRMIKWKRPKMAVMIAKHLRDLGVSFEMRMLGTGEKIGEIKRLVTNLDLDGCIDIIGAVNAESVRQYMREADIFLATSDQNEGWGVVVNEAMNSGCVVFATVEMGSVPVLIQDGKNGFYLKNGYEMLAAKKIRELENDKQLLRTVKKAAYATMQDHFSPDIYAQRYVEIANKALCGERIVYDHLGSKAVMR